MSDLVMRSKHRQTLATTRWLRAAAFTLAFVAVAAGCNSDPIERAAVSGSVTLDGRPIPQGLVRFVPADGPTWSAWIKDGRYTTEGTKGVPVGELQVVIEAYRIPAWYKPTGAIQAGDETPLEQYLPPKYNERSELKMTIEPRSGQVEKNFELALR